MPMHRCLFIITGPVQVNCSNNLRYNDISNMSNICSNNFSNTINNCHKVNLRNNNMKLNQKNSNIKFNLRNVNIKINLNIVFSSRKK